MSTSNQRSLFPSYEKYIPILLILLALLFFTVFFIDRNWSSLDQEEKQVIGRLTHKENVIQRKGSKDRLWSHLSVNSTLHDQDIIRADHLSGAEIRIFDGTLIKIEENSMFRLDYSGKKAKLNFERGSISIKQNKKNTKSLVVEAGGHAVELKQSDAKLESLVSAKKEKQVNLSLTTGEAQVFGKEETKAKKYTASSGQLLQLADKGVEIKQLPVTLLKPADQVNFSSKRDKQTITFHWKNNTKLQNTHLQIATKRSFHNPLHSISTSALQYNLSLPSGSYYWRISGVDKKTNKIASSSHKFRIIKDEELNIFTPNLGKTFTYVAQPPFVRFSWSPLDLAQQYYLEVSVQKSFKTAIRRVGLLIPTYSLKLSAGKYYWRVKALANLEGIKPIESEIYTFHIKKVRRSVPPRLLQPSEKQSFFNKDIPQKSLLFVWSSIPEYTHFTYQLSKTSDFRQLIIQKNTIDNYVSLNRRLSPNIYYWRVRGEIQDDRGKGKGKSSFQGKFSSIHSFQIKKKEPIAKAKKTKEKIASISKSINPSIDKRKAIRKTTNKSGLDKGKAIRTATNKSDLDKGKAIRTTTNDSAINEKEFIRTVADPGIDEKEVIPDTGWKVPELLVPRQLANYSLADYYKHIKQLTFRCKKAGPPDILIEECFPTYIVLNREGKHRLDLFYFYKITSKHLRDRRESYAYFKNSCNFRPAYDYIRYELQPDRKLGIEERRLIAETYQALIDCPK